MKSFALRFLKIYLVFFLFSILVNLSLELLVPTPEEKDPTGIIMFYSIFDLVGSLIYFYKKFRARIMGGLSFILGFICEFTFMRPEWVLKIYDLSINGDVIVAVLVSSVYWFIAWFIPSFILHKYREKLRV